MLSSEDEVVVEVGVGKNATSIVGYTYAPDPLCITSGQEGLAHPLVTAVIWVMKGLVS